MKEGERVRVYFLSTKTYRGSGHRNIMSAAVSLMESANWLVNNDMRGTASRSRDRNQHDADYMPRETLDTIRGLRERRRGESQRASEGGVFKRD